jgi:cytochrome c-type biogenesis protein CcmH/NrfG
LIYLSIALGGKGDFNNAAKYYIMAKQKKEDPLFGENEIINIFTQWVKQSPRNTNAQYCLGSVLQDFGHYPEALKIFQGLLKVNSLQEIVKSHIAWLTAAEKAYGME